jgi:hypothetical protein
MREKGSQWLSMVGWWLLVVELVVEGGAGGRNDSCRRANREEENVNGDASGLLPLWRKKEK